MKFSHLCLVWSLVGFFGANSVLALDIQQYPALQKLVDTMVQEDGYPREELIEVLAGANIDPKVIELMDRPYESLDWHRYRALFVKQSRIVDGVRFWNEHRPILEAAYERYGVPPRIIVALIGVETHYGSNLGNRRVLNSLVTLTANYPRRSRFFGKELRTFLNTARKENIPEREVRGSYAGAIGIPQFMPSSYEAYAVDFNQNGTRDLVNEMADAIGSVANYLVEHRWTREEAILAYVTARLPDAAQDLVSQKVKLEHSVSALQAAGVVFDAKHGSEAASLIAFVGQSDRDYVVAYRNFYSITRYNTSKNYARAVVELSEEIARRMY